jgi:ankyrin repeat protein
MYVSYDGNPLLNVVAYYGLSDCVRVLLEKGADTAAKGKNGQSAYRTATEMNHFDCVRVFLEHGVNLVFKNYDGRP